MKEILIGRAGAALILAASLGIVGLGAAARVLCRPKPEEPFSDGTGAASAYTHDDGDEGKLT